MENPIILVTPNPQLEKMYGNADIRKNRKLERPLETEYNYRSKKKQL